MDERGESKLESDAGRSEILYKLGQIETKLEVYRTGWSEPVKRIEEMLTELKYRSERDMVQVKLDQSKMEDAQQKTREDIHSIRNSLQNLSAKFEQVDKNTGDISNIKTDIANWKVRFSTVIATVVVAWAVLGDTVSNWLARTFN